MEHVERVFMRAKNILLTPASEWPVIAEENTRVGDIFYGYVLILAAIPPLAILIGYSVIFGRIGFGFAFIGGIVQYSLSLGAVFFVALVAQWLSPKFGGRDDLVQATKLVSYSHTATWVGGLFFLIPFIRVASLLLALYGIYLAYLGATPVMAVPPERAAPYTIAVILTVIVVFFLISLVMSIFLGLGMLGMMV
jgi:hypothetical protein